MGSVGQAAITRSGRLRLLDGRLFCSSSTFIDATSCLLILWTMHRQMLPPAAVTAGNWWRFSFCQIEHELSRFRRAACKARPVGYVLWHSGNDRQPSSNRSATRLSEPDQTGQRIEVSPWSPDDTLSASQKNHRSLFSSGALNTAFWVSCFCVGKAFAWPAARHSSQTATAEVFPRIRPGHSADRNIR
jgi:hypothetical protein